MPNSNVNVKVNFTPKNERHPELPNKLVMDGEGLRMFKAAPVGVMFTGVVHLPTKVVFLHPLVATRAGNVEMEMRVDAHVDGVGAVDGVRDTFPLLHPNLTPTQRAMVGETSGHTKICQEYLLNEEECVGFAVSKQSGQHELATNSRTLNSTKFLAKDHKYDGMARIGKTMWDQNSEFGPGGFKRGDGALNREWANLIAATLQIANTHFIKTPQGHAEAPY